MWARVTRIGLLGVIFLALVGAGSPSLPLPSGVQGFVTQAISAEVTDRPSAMSSKGKSLPPAEPPGEPVPDSRSQSNLQPTGQPQQLDAAPLADMRPSGDGYGEPYYVPGNLVILQPTTSFLISAGGSIRFSAILSNQGDRALSLTGELIVIKGDGTSATLLPSRGLKLKAGQKIQLPVELAVKSWHFPPGRTEFLAILRDLQGEIIDRASVTFQISVPLQE